MIDMPPLDSQTRASHFLSDFIGRLLVIGARKANAASRRLLFFCTF